MLDLVTQLGADIVDVVRDVVPGGRLGGARLETGEFHSVVLIPDVAAVRIAHHRGTAPEMRRNAGLTHRLAALLPVDVPHPLGPVREADGRAVLATAWVRGSPAPKGTGDPTELGRVLATLGVVETGPLQDVLAPAHSYAGGDRWEEMMLGAVLGRLPQRSRSEARRRVEAALALPPVPPSLVHGDLAGANMHWDEDGRLRGILDWDLAAAWDPAVDAACLSWHGWDAVRGAVDEATYERARVWAATFGIEQVAAAIDRGASTGEVDEAVERAADWLDRTRSTFG